MARLVRGIVIGGPTGIGKTDLAVLLAQRLDGELISCDSVQIYRGLQIGANKSATPVPQHLLDVRDWWQPFTAADFYELAAETVREVISRGKVPILVGGTGFYLDWIINGRPGAPPTDPRVMEEIEIEIANDQGDWEKSRDRLSSVDPEYASIVRPNDYYRLKRALVVHRMTGQPLSSFKDKHQLDHLKIDWRCFYLTTSDRPGLLRHIDRRCEAMVKKGLIEEVIRLRKQGFNRNCSAGRSIGYNEAHLLLDQLAHLSPDQLDQAFLAFLSNFQSQTRQYTRKQEKWFHAMKVFRWLERPSLVEEDLPQPLVDEAVQLYQMPRSQFDDLYDPTVSKCFAFRDLCKQADPKDRRKLMRTFRSRLELFSKPETRLDFIQTHILSFNRS